MVEGVSKQNSHPFKVVKQKKQSRGFFNGLVYL